jgi:hypothetical protein
MSKVAKSAHVATIDKAQHTFAATDIYPYRPNIIFDEYLGTYDTIHKDKKPVLEGTESGNSNVRSLPRVDGPHLPIPVSARTPDNAATASMGAISPLPKAFVEDKQFKTKCQASEILPGTTYKTFIETN